MEFQLVKIFDEETANALKESGFSYAIEKYNDKTIFVFEATKKLLEILLGQYSENNDFIFENKLSF